MIRSGFVNVIKPTGASSSNIVCAVKKILKEKKVGHLGTLDPAASGVLPIAFGKATKFFDYFLKKDKEYVAVVKFGIETDTLDSFGLITKTEDVSIKKDDILNVLSEFTGKIKQVPPKYSALKVDGKKACDLARSGEDFNLKEREIDIYSIELLGEEEKNVFRFKVHCSSGTYIRTLFSDIAKRLNTISTTTVIIRTRSGRFDIKDAITLEVFEKSLKTISVQELFSDLRTLNVKNEEVLKKLLNGVKLTYDDIKEADNGASESFNGNTNFFITAGELLLGMYHFEKERLICDVFLAE